MNEDRLKTLREEMVETQLIPRGISDKLVLKAMRKVLRHKFMPKDMENLAYDDGAIPIGEGQTISQPYMVAIMTELLRLKGGEKVLEVGTGSGYQAAILGEIAGKVYTMEVVEILADRTQKLLRDMGYKNIEVVLGDGTLGLPEQASFDAIIVTAGSPDIPKPLTDQLAEGGRLVIPVGDRFSQKLLIVSKKNGKLMTEESIGCVFVPLKGEFGWPG
jgi:protein-L-isoaspartate(D-aspartate) O-methyltransferase